MLKCILTEWIGNLFPAKPEYPLTAPGLMQRYHISRAYRKQMRSAGGGEMDSRENVCLLSSILPRKCSLGCSIQP